MAIKKTKNGSYQLKIYIPSDVRSKLGLGEYYEKRYKTRREAKLAETQITVKIDEVRLGVETKIQEQDITFKEFYEEYWLDAYKAGQTTFTNTPPVASTIFQTESLFRLHLLPMFGKYSLKYLMSNKQLVLNKLTAKANEYANFKIVRSYTNSIFDWAEELEFIEGNRLKKSISRIKPIRKVQLQRTKNEEEKYLNQEELSQWLQAIEQDFSNDRLSLMDYTLFYTTFLLSDRKSETYALRWKDIHFDENRIDIFFALDRFRNLKTTKSNKKTSFIVSDFLMDLLAKWKVEQKKYLKQFKIRQTEKQFVFTAEDNKGGINRPLHIDYLNYRMKRLEKRYPELTHATPHMLRHTGATLARKAGISLEEISEALTHSDTRTTQVYVNTPDTIRVTAGEVAYNIAKNDSGKNQGNSQGNF